MKVQVRTGHRNGHFEMQTMPHLGEYVEVADKIYRVSMVVHTSGDKNVAGEIYVELVDHVKLTGGEWNRLAGLNPKLTPDESEAWNAASE